MNPNDVARNRTARLVREARTPTYSTSTKPVEVVHTAIVEIDGGMGRYRVEMPENEVSHYLDNVCWEDEGLSDLYHSPRCKCGNPDFML